VRVWIFWKHSIMSCQCSCSCASVNVSSHDEWLSRCRARRRSDPRVHLEVTCNKDRGKRESALPSLPFRLFLKPINVARSFSSTPSFSCGFLAHTPAGPADQASVCCNGASAAFRHGPFGLLFEHRLMPLISVGVALQSLPSDLVRAVR
jgi:hypothetical protein